MPLVQWDITLLDCFSCFPFLFFICLHIFHVICCSTFFYLLASCVWLFSCHNFRPRYVDYLLFILYTVQGTYHSCVGDRISAQRRLQFVFCPVLWRPRRPQEISWIFPHDCFRVFFFVRMFALTVARCQVDEGRIGLSNSLDEMVDIIRDFDV